MSNLTFDTAPATTVYIEAQNGEGIFLTNPVPTSSGGRVVKNGGAFIRIMPANVDW